MGVIFLFLVYVDGIVEGAKTNLKKKVSKVDLALFFLKARSNRSY